MKLKTFLIMSQILAIVVSISLLGITNFYYMYRNVKEEVYYKNDMLARANAQHISEILEDAVRLMLQIKDVYESNNDKEKDKVDEFIAQIVSREPFFESMEILNSQGNVVKTIPQNSDLLDLNHSRYEFFQKIKDGENLYWSSSFVSMQTGRPTVILAMPMKDGVLAGYLDLQRISDLTDSFSANYGKQLFLVVTDAKGITIAHSDLYKVLQREWSSDLFKLHFQMDEPSPDYEIIHNGTKYLASVQNLNDMGWHVIVYQASSEAFAVLQRIELFFIFTALISLIAAIAFSWRKIDNAFESLAKLNNRFMKIAEGDFEKQKVPEKFAELKEMSAYLDHMTDSIRERDNQLHQLAHKDILTDLPNRALFFKCLQEAVLDNEPFALIFLDLDNFKMINDTYGHYRGDQVLIKVTEKLQELKEKNVLLARIGGDEFVFLVRDWQPERGIAWLNNLCEKISGDIQIENLVFFAEASIGISTYPKDSLKADELLRFADMAMYQAKASGKNRYCFFTLEMSRMIKRKNDLVEQLRNKNVFDELALHYQPILTSDGQKLRGFEALLRWKNKKMGIVSPAEFIPIMEELGLIQDVGRWVLRNACENLAFLHEKTNSRYIMSVNVSALQLRDKRLADDIADSLNMFGLASDQLELEITESAIIASLDEANCILKKIKELGILISLDDFGTGYSALSYLQKLPIDTLKIDRSFFVDVMENEKSKAMLNGIISLAQNIKVDVIAEGVEIVAQAEIVKEISCDYCQGYLFSKPMPAAETLIYCQTFESKQFI